MQVRWCPECEEEYRPEIVHCADCGTLLVDRDDEVPLPAPSASSPAGSSLPPGDYRGIFATNRSAELEPMAKRLGAAGIPFQVGATGYQAFDLRVRVEERKRALECLKDLMPVVEESGPDRELIEESRSPQCPACEAKLPERVEECPECGLTLSPSEIDCDQCGTVFPGDEPRCPKCGTDV
jgi:ssDNA-binding Zn-finger/Zn-ribbon topoisomerase 1